GGEPLGRERLEDDGVDLPSPLTFDVGQAGTELLLGLAAVPAVPRRAERFLHLPACGVTVLHPPDRSALAVIPENTRAARHLSRLLPVVLQPRSQAAPRCRRHAAGASRRRGPTDRESTARSPPASAGLPPEPRL